jgi:predicted transcriptional regulator
MRPRSDRHAARRPDGTLEREVLTVLWQAAGPLQPSEINDRLPTKLAYTSVATVLGRLHAKGLVTREPSGRAYAYTAAVDESELAVRRIDDVLAGATDPAKVLSRFVDGLSERDARMLRALLDDSP